MTRDYGYWDAQKFVFKWNGRYIATAILTLNPLAKGMFILSNIFPVLLILFLFLVLMRLISIYIEPSPIIIRAMMALVILSIYIVNMPIISQGFYWLAGSVTYQLSNIIALIIFISIRKPLDNNLYYLFLFILCILLCGLNELTILLTIITFSIYFIYRVEKKIQFRTIYILVILISMLLIVAFFSGNKDRINEFQDNHSVIFSLKSAIQSSLYHFIKWIFISPIIPCL